MCKDGHYLLKNYGGKEILCAACANNQVNISVLDAGDAAAMPMNPACQNLILALQITLFIRYSFFLQRQLAHICLDECTLHIIIKIVSVFQLGLFLRELRPARTGLRPARFRCALPELKKTQNIYFLFKKNVIAVFVFSDSCCKNACKMLAVLCPCFHQSPTRPNFGCSRVTDFVSFAN